MCVVRKPLVTVPKIAYYNYKVREAFLTVGRQVLRSGISLSVIVNGKYYGTVSRLRDGKLVVMLFSEVVTDRVQLPIPVSCE